MMKVPTLIHQNVPHNGGVHAVKTEAIESVDNKIFASNMKTTASAGNDSKGEAGTKTFGKTK